MSDFKLFLKKYKAALISGLLLIAVICAIVLYPSDIGGNMTVPDVTAADKSLKDDDDGLSVNWKALKKKYKDLVGYLKVPGTTIEDIVVQADDNKYYLRRSATDTYKYAGTYFADYRCDMTNLSTFTTIYGHNLNDESTLFGQLAKYKSLSFYKENPVIRFDTPNIKGKWLVFGIFAVNIDKSDFIYRVPEHDTDEQVLEVINKVRSRSIIDCPINVDASDKFLTLYTCYYPGISDDNYRFVVMARLLRESESDTVNVEEASYRKPEPLTTG